jgi:DNA repair ATPase RecN
MFKSIRVQNFQSLRDVDVELAPFTVIVGATDSGKSAFFRAISTLISNRRGSDFITYGERLCTITAELEQGTLKLQRGAATKDNFYEVRRGDDTELYSKLSGTVPEEVSKFLRIPPKDPINLASQFDKPYLLDSKEYSPAEAARILGALTNVNILFEGARESNRRKGEASTKLKTRTADAESVAEQLHSYDALERQVEAITRAEKAAEALTKLTAAKASVETLIQDVEEGTRTLAQVAEAANVHIPDISEVEKLATAKVAILELVSTIEAAQAEIVKLEALAKKEAEAVVELDELYRETLRKEGTCPTCGQSTM